MNIQKFLPSPRLRPYIKQYYLAEGNLGKKTQDVFFADGCLEVVFNLDLTFYRNNQIEPWAKLIGQITEPLHVEAKGQGKSFGIWFTPHGFSMFSDIPVKALNDQAIPLGDIFHDAFIDAVGSHLERNETERLIGTINHYFEALLSKSVNAFKEKVTNYAVEQITHPRLDFSLNSLAKNCNVSNRYLQKIFAESIGLSPKKLQRVFRFQHVLQKLSRAGKTELTALAYEAGYADQSHFIREFKTFTNFTPSQYQQHSHPINQYFINA